MHLQLKREADLLFVLAPNFDLYLPNYGIAYVAEALKRAGFQTALADLNVNLAHAHRNEKIEKYWNLEKDYYWNTLEGFAKSMSVFGRDFEDVIAQIAEHPAPIIGFSINMFNIMATEMMAAQIRALAPGKTIIYGGYSCQFDHICRNFKEPDYICLGESERSAPMIVEAILHGGDPGSVPGVREVRKGTGRFSDCVREENLDSLAWPRWEDFDLPLYTLKLPEPTLPVATSRGCSWGHCVFCSSHKAVAGFRQRSAEVTFAELSYNYNRYAISSFSTVDLLLNGDNAELERLCDLIIASGLKFKFPFVYFHAEKRLTAQLLHKLKAAGFHTLTFGIEYGANRMLKLMRKGHSVKIIEECFKRVKEAGLFVAINLIMGFPGETEKDVEELGQFLERNRSVIDAVELIGTCGALSGSDLYEERESYGMVFTPVPGVEMVVDWVSADGANTFAERTRRCEWIKRKAQALGYLLGGTYSEPSLADNLYGNLLSQLENLTSGSRVLLLRSCSIVPFNQIRSILHSQFEKVSLDILIQESAAKMLEEIPNFLERKYICPDGPMSKQNMPSSVFQDLQRQSYEWILIPMSNMPRDTYQNIFDLSKELAAKKILVFKPDGLCEIL